MMILLALAALAPAEPLARPAPPAIGSETVVPTGLDVPRPATRPCIVELFAEREFAGEARVPIAYRPPADCPGPWAKIVFEGDLHVTAGEQYDRTGFVTIAGVNLFTGTTMEPRQALAPRWHVERDVTDYAATLAAPQPGEATLTNYVDARYTGRLFWSGRLLFYPADAATPAPRVPDWIEPLATAPAKIDAQTPAVTRTLTFPRNVERLMIDVLAQPQAEDEFWWLCQPDPAGTPPADPQQRGCGAPFREAEVLIDGKLAGIAAAYPWIYTGGVNPRMWSLTPAVEALDLPPTRLDLTPFAALVNDGQPHAVSLRIVGASRYFFAMGTLLAWRDAGRAVVGGALDANTLASARVALTGTPAPAAADRFAETLTTATRDGRAVGHVDTSHGRVTTSVDYRFRFRNRQRGAPGGGEIDQDSAVDTRREIRGPDGITRHQVAERFPLFVAIESHAVGPDQVSDTHFRQGLTRVETTTAAGRTHRRTTALLVEPRVHMVVPPSGRRDAKVQATTVTTTRVMDDAAGCYDRTVTVTDNRVAAVREECPLPRRR
ncbi:peptide-N4-asparagine amidase [Sphingomonas sp. KR1UV-12]|uniref:Peptide-N4-asparagine amidase n=1 Tax=Sphingomonas aurea TaxID=3063994 RepID=A0ABT9ELE8_9SPHN|nr:peptide-N4-asparagine amidase [Sphingomonas sp. KR1UV-12]MDP1027652.1 peptide-N4-asparagine amidase [Sphingomonas sp. KR1UV-12]